jgi:hypothetical protein
VRTGDALDLVIRRAANVRADRTLAVLTHPARCGYQRDAVQLRPRRALRRLDVLDRHPERTSSQLEASAARGHHGDYIALGLVELRDEVGCPRDPILQGEYLVGSELV